MSGKYSKLNFYQQLKKKAKNIPRDGSFTFPENRNKTRTSNVGYISKAQKKTKTILENVKETFGITIHSVPLQNIKKLECGTLRRHQKSFKKVAHCRKKSKGRPFSLVRF